MFDKLENLLNKWTYPIKTELYMHAFETLKGYGCVRAWSEISKYIEYAETEDSTSQILDTIENCLTIEVDATLLEHSVVMNSELALKIEVLDALNFIQVVEDNATISGIINQANNEMEVFLDLLAYASNKSWEYFSEGILSVSPALLDKLRELIEDKTVASLEAEPVGEVDPKIVKISMFLENHHTSLVTHAITVDYRKPGTPINILMNYYKLPLLSLEGEDAKQAALELVGIALISDTTLDKVPSVAKELIDLVYSDITFCTQVIMHIDHFIAEVMNG